MSRYTRIIRLVLAAKRREAKRDEQERTATKQLALQERALEEYSMMNRKRDALLNVPIHTTVRSIRGSDEHHLIGAPIDEYDDGSIEFVSYGFYREAFEDKEDGGKIVVEGGWDTVFAYWEHRDEVEIIHHDPPRPLREVLSYHPYSYHHLLTQGEPPIPN